MRWALGILILATSGSASACSWPKYAPNPIEQNVAIARCCMVLVFVIFCKSLMLALRRRNGFWAPVILTVFLALVWFALGTAYSGDCGGLALIWGVLSIPLSLITLGGQRLAAYREDQIKKR